MFVFTVLFISLAFAIVLFVFLDWTAHISMTKNNSNQSAWANYSMFKRWFEKYNWSNDSSFKNSLWDKKKNCEYHAGIIKFEENGMKINNPIGYILVKLHVRRYIKNKKLHNQFSFKDELARKTSEKKGYNVYISDGEPIFVSMEEIYGQD